MLFNSYIFILLFLPLTWCIYFGLNHFRLYQLGQCALIIASFVFYGYQNPKLCLLLLFTIIANYGGHVFLTGNASPRMKKLVLFLGVTGNILLLFVFKYLDFTLEIFNSVLKTDFVLYHIALPLGISFFTFQQISMLVDSSKPEMQRYNFIDYALFVSFFPQLVAGPIVLHQEMIPQFYEEEKKKINWENITAGLEYFILGLGKKVLIADTFANICDAGYENLASLNVYSTILTILAFTLQIYFDFSGYCDMAKGLGKLFNLEIPINFNSPYKALTIAEFWKRWHCTLTRFLTQYLYIPLGGNRKGKWRTYLNVMIVFTVSGLWHGADYTFIFWGMIHGLMQVIYRMGRRFFDKLPKLVLWLSTFSFVNIAWVFFRADYSKQPFHLLKRLFVGGGGLCQEPLLSAFTDSTISLAVVEIFTISGVFAVLQQVWILLWFAVWTFVCVKMPSSHEMVEKRNRSWAYYGFALGLIFALSFICLSRISKFIYFNF